MEIITSINNNYIKELSKLKIKKYRDEKRLFIIEGYHLIEMAKDYLVSILTVNSNDINKYGDCNYYLVDEKIIAKLSSTCNNQGIIGICKFIDNNNPYSDNIIMLDGLQDPGNIGTIIRSGIAFNYNTMILSNDCCDIYNDKVIRSSQGGIFNINIKYCNLIDEIKNLKENGYTIYATALRNSKCIDDIDFALKNVIIIGNEGNGIKDEILDLSDERVYIPINNIESLNAGVACSIVLNDVRRKHLKK